MTDLPGRVRSAAQVSFRRPRRAIYTTRMTAHATSCRTAPASADWPKPSNGIMASAIASTTVSRPHRAPEKKP